MRALADGSSCQGSVAPGNALYWSIEVICRQPGPSHRAAINVHPEYGEVILGTNLDEDAIFRRARLIPALKQRVRFVDHACGDDTALRARVAKLLKADESPWTKFDGGFKKVSGGHEVTPAIANYHLLEKIGAGGMADVFSAEQLVPFHREVAVKVQRTNRVGSASFRRFEREQQTLAKLKHENIATIYDAGITANGNPFVTMELVRGVPITTFCNDHRLTIAARVRLMRDVCKGVEYAHHHGIIHRDLKPENILVTELVRGPQPKIIDFGVAKNSEALNEPKQTEDGQILGTLDYMSPEQIRCEFSAVDAHTDVFSLGVVLHEMLVDEIPLARELKQTNALADRLKCLCETVPRSVSRTLRDVKASPEFAHARGTNVDGLAKQFTPVLDQIVSRMLAKRVEERYATIEHLTADLDRYLNGGASGEKSTPKHTGNWWQQPYSLGLVCLLSFLLISGFVALLSSQKESVLERKGANNTTRGAEHPGVVAPLAETPGLDREVGGMNGKLEVIDLSTERDGEPDIPERAKEKFYYLVHDMRPVAAFQFAKSWGAGPLLDQLRNELVVDVKLRGIPEEAEVAICDWNNEPFEWCGVKVTGETVMLPLGEVFIETLQKRVVPSVRVRVTCSGYRTKEFVLNSSEVRTFGGEIELVKQIASNPDDMTLVFGAAEHVEVNAKYPSPRASSSVAFWFDTLEVSNQEYLEFVEAGAYESPEFWSSTPFLLDGVVQPFETAMKLFLDRTGHPGPASWIDGRFPDGTEMHPVAGISFFEATAYARFRGKRLPTIGEWRQAASGRTMSALVVRSNFGSEGPARCGKHTGISRFNVRDLGGNVREWCSTVDQRGQGYILGGSWKSPRKVLSLNVAADRWNRDTANGVRCCKGSLEITQDAADGSKVDEFLSSNQQAEVTLLAPPAELRAIHDYDPNNATEARGNQVDNETLSELGVFYTIAELDSAADAAAADDTSFHLHLFAPTGSVQPVGCVMMLSEPHEFSPYKQHGSELAITETGAYAMAAKIVTERRMVLCILELGADRGSGGESHVVSKGSMLGENSQRPDLSRNRVMKAMRALDYLASRRDLDSEQFCLLAFGATGQDAVRLLALDDRLQGGVLVSTGYENQSKLGSRFMDFKKQGFGTYHYAPLVTQPVLMINSSLDLEFPEITSQLPLYNELGSNTKERIKILHGGSLQEPEQLDDVLLHAVAWLGDMF